MSGITSTVAIMKPVLAQVISCRVAPSEPRICDRATLTMEESMEPIRVPKDTERVTSHLLTGPLEAGVAMVSSLLGEAVMGKWAQRAAMSPRSRRATRMRSTPSSTVSESVRTVTSGDSGGS